MIAIAAGLFALFRPGITGLALMVVIAAWAIARGAFEIIAAVRLPEKSAIVAEIEETWVIPVDTRMEAIGGLVIRRPRAELIDEQRARELAAQRKEIDSLKHQYELSTGAVKTGAKTKLDALEDRFKDLQTQTNEMLESLEREGEAKVEVLQEQARKAKDQATANLELRANELRADYQSRSRKLRKALELTKDALKP